MTPREDKIKFKEAERLAKKGDVKAQKELANMYCEGIGVVQDKGRAIKILKPLAEQGDSRTQLELYFIYDSFQYDEDGTTRKSIAEGQMWLQRSAEAGYAHAQCILASAYLYGTYGEKDISKAVKLCELSLEQCFDDAFEVLDDLYMNNNLPGGKERVEYWYRFAAERGNSGAQYYLGDKYFEGIDVKKDLNEGFEMV